MPRRLWLSAGLLATGAVLLATARLAGATPQSGQIFRVGFAGASVEIDPQMSYISTGWWMEYATAAKLYNWSDRGTKLVPEVASRAVISNRGRTYTFMLRKGFRFSDGSPVTAKNFAFAFDRVANRDLASPAYVFIHDVIGIRAKGSYKLVIRLVKPDPTFISKLTMPFFQATSTTLPLNQEVVNGYPSAGPYYFASNAVNTLTTLRRNPYWRGNRSAHVDGVDVQWGLDEDTAFQEVQANQLDETSVSDGNAQTAGRQYGVNKTRFWAMPQNCLGLLMFNRLNPLFGRSVALRKAVNWAVDRTAYAALAGPYAGTPWTHLLPPLFPGSIGRKSLQPYSAHANLTKARKLAGAYVANRRITVGYRSSGSIFQAQERQLLLPPESARISSLGTRPQRTRAFAFPPSGNGMDGEGRRIVRDADTDSAAIVQRVVNAVGDAYAAGIGKEVVIVDQNGRAVPFGAGIFETADHFAFPTIDADDGKTLALEASP